MENRFTTKNKEDEDLELVVKSPTNKQLLESEKVYKRAFRQALEHGAILRKKLGMYMQEQEIWTAKQEAEYMSVIKEINLLDYQLNTGKSSEGNKLKLSEAKEIALTLKDKRVEFRDLISERQEMDHLTAEGQADTERFSNLVFACTFDFLTQKPFYKDMDDYLEKANDTASVDAAKHVGSVVYEVDPNYENDLTENKFLRRFKFSDDENRLVDSEGKHVDREGKAVDGEGYVLNEDGKRVNINDLPVLKDEETVEKVEFEDDLGVLSSEEAEPPKKRKKAVTKEV
tara:strand:+ start:52 stop:909 length:858 start_codon:yes stop_codon:yes gene_type:complete